MAGKHTEKLTELVTNLSRQNTEQHQGLMDLGIQLAIYQALAGPLPQGVVQDVVMELNKLDDKPATFSTLIGVARAIAAKLLQAAQKAAEELETEQPTAAEGRSPYSAPSAAPSSPRPVLYTAGSGPEDRAPRIVLPRLGGSFPLEP